MHRAGDLSAGPMHPYIKDDEMLDSDVRAGAVRRAIDSTARISAYIGGAGIVLLMLLAVAGVVARKMFDVSPPAVLDFTEVALVFVVYLGMAYAEVDRSHIRTNMVTDRLPRRVSDIGRTVVWVIALAFLLLVTWLTAVAAVESFLTSESRPSSSFIPIWPARAVVSFGLLGLAAQAALNVIDYGRAVRLSFAAATSNGSTS